MNNENIKYENDKDFMEFIKMMKLILDKKETKTFNQLFGRIYNDATNYLTSVYQIDPEESIEIVEELIKEKKQDIDIDSVLKDLKNTKNISTSYLQIKYSISFIKAKKLLKDIEYIRKNENGGENLC